MQKYCIKTKRKSIKYKCTSLVMSIVVLMAVVFESTGCESLEDALTNLNDEFNSIDSDKDINSNSEKDDYSEKIINSNIKVKTLQEELAGDTYGLLYPKQREEFVGRQYYHISNEEDMIRAISDGLSKGIRGIVLQYDTHDYRYWENILEKNKNRSEFGGYLNAGFVTDYAVNGELGIYPSYNETWQAICYYRYKEPEIGENTMRLLESAHKLAEDAIKVSPDDEIGMLSYINEQICKMTTYSDPIPSGLNVPQRDATGVFLNGDAVCAGYATAFELVLNILGIENCTLNNDEKPDAANAHIWNYVKVNGSWYHIDATWNDNDSNDTSCMHEYFMLTDDELAKKDDSTAHNWIKTLK